MKISELAKRSATLEIDLDLSSLRLLDEKAEKAMCIDTTSKPPLRLKQKKNIKEWYAEWNADTNKETEQNVANETWPNLDWTHTVWTYTVKWWLSFELTPWNGNSVLNWTKCWNTVTPLIARLENIVIMDLILKTCLSAKRKPQTHKKEGACSLALTYERGTRHRGTLHKYGHETQANQTHFLETHFGNRLTWGKTERETQAGRGSPPELLMGRGPHQIGKTFVGARAHGNRQCSLGWEDHSSSRDAHAYKTIHFR